MTIYELGYNFKHGMSATITNLYDDYSHTVDLKELMRQIMRKYIVYASKMSENIQKLIALWVVLLAF